jgi:hypothetical protein
MFPKLDNSWVVGESAKFPLYASGGLKATIGDEGGVHFFNDEFWIDLKYCSEGLPVLSGQI